MRAQSGNIDPDGQIVGRVAAAVGEHRAADVDHESQVGLVLELLARAEQARRAANGRAVA